jgi:hypothetical protein
MMFASTTNTNNTQRGLPTYVRYADLVAANIVGNWTQLLRLIELEGFPTGVMLSPNTRAWGLDDVRAWLATRPTARKVMPPPTKPRGRSRNPRVREEPTQGNQIAK